MNADDLIMVNPNSATVDELTQLPGIGPDIARRIINGRPYNSLENLTRISGIGPVLFEQVKPSLTLESGDDLPDQESDFNQPGDPEDLKDDSGQEESPVEENQEDEDNPPQKDFDSAESIETDALAEAEFDQDEDTPSKTIAEASDKEQTDPDIEEDDFPSAPEEMPETPPAPAPPAPGISRSSAIGWAAFSGILAMLLSVILSLGIIASINGGSLKFVTQSEFQRQQAALAELEKQSDQQTIELEGIHERLANLEAMSGRINSLEKSVGAVQGEMDVANGQLVEFAGELEILTEETVGIAADVENIKAQLGRSETFFESMRNLLNNLFPEEQEQ